METTRPIRAARLALFTGTITPGTYHLTLVRDDATGFGVRSPTLGWYNHATRAFEQVAFDKSRHYAPLVRDPDFGSTMWCRVPGEAVTRGPGTVFLFGDNPDGLALVSTSDFGVFGMPVIPPRTIELVTPAKIVGTLK